MGAKKQIMIVEDESQFAEMVKLRLELAGHSVSIALNTNEGIQKIMNSQNDLIILDLMMPGGGGIAILEAMRKDPDKANIPVIVVTGKTLTPEVKKQLEPYQVAGVFIKPYNPVEFLSKINELLA
jgi:DNA-binding response OmpR family regulator